MMLTPERLAELRNAGPDYYVSGGTLKLLLAHIDAQHASIAELENAICNSLGGTHYLDQPDGGSVDLLEQLSRMAQDAARYRALREILQNSVGGGVEVNDAALVYEKAEPGTEVRVYWYPNTPVGFNEAHGATLDAAVDNAIAGGDE